MMSWWCWSAGLKVTDTTRTVTVDPFPPALTEVCMCVTCRQEVIAHHEDG